jgi:HEAT repeat protein
MRKLLQLLFLIVAVIGGVFAAIWVLMRLSGGDVETESAAERRAKELQKVRGLLAKWDSLDPAARAKSLPELKQVWQFGDPDLRWDAAFALGHSGPPAAAYLLALIQDPDDDVRMYAVWAIGIQGDEFPRSREGFEAVCKCLKDSNSDVRKKAIFAVGRIADGPEAAVPPLVAAFSDSDSEVREAASAAVARFGKGAVPELRKTLKSDSLEVRRLAVATLGLIGPDAAEAIPDLLAALRDAQSGLQDETAEALAGIGPSALQALADAVQQDQDQALRKRAIFALARVGKPAVPVLAKTLGDKDPSVRLQAVTSLGRIGADAVEPLVGAFKDEDTEVRQEAARVLGTMNKSDPGVVPALVRALKDPQDMVRGQAINSLQLLRADADAVLAELTPVLEDKNVEVRLGAIRFLGEFGPPAVPRLASMLKDPEPAVWRTASTTLEKTAAPEKLLYPALLPLLKEESPTARQNAVNILWRCGPQAVPDLVAALKDKTSLVRVAAVRSLHQTNADAKIAFPAMVEALEDESPLVRASAAVALGKFGTQAIPNLTIALKDKEPSVRQYAVLALPELKSSPKEVLPLLLQAQSDDNAQVRAAAAKALGSFGLPAAKYLIEALKDKDAEVWKQAVDALKKLEGPPAPLARLLNEAIKDEHYSVRRGAAYVLSRFGPDAVEPLVAALKDPDDRVRWEAADSLRVVGPQADKALAPLAAAALGDSDPKVRKVSLEAMLWIQGLERFRDDPPKAVPSLMDSLGSKHAQTRLEAAQVLEVLGPPAKDALPALTKATQDKDERVRKAASAALARIKGG